MARVLIVDDHVVVRTVLRQAMLQAGHDVVGEAADGASGIEAAHELLPDLVLMDVSMPGVDGITATQRLRRRLPDVRVLVVTMHAEQDVVARARAAGAAGYLLKDASQDAVAAAVATVLAGGEVFAETNAVGAEAHDDDLDLTEREVEVLRLLSEGATPREVATALLVSPRAVAGHLGRLFEKLEVQTRVDAVMEGRRRGILPDGSVDRQPPARG
jgi:DNA-binding NarL/FixJ family response regulator